MRVWNPAWLGACALALLATACTTAELAQPAAEMPRIATLARTDDFLILRVEPGVTYAMLADTYLGSAAFASTLAKLNGAIRPGPGQPVIVPLRAANASGVFADGYQTVPILCYHRFTEGASHDPMEMPRASFVAHMAYLKDNDYHVIALADLEEFLNGGKPIPPRSVVITVDDGFRSAFEIAYPILKEYGFPATFFLYTDFIGPRLALDWEAIEQLRAEGIVDIQSHSRSHTSFAPQPEEEEGSAGYADRLVAEIAEPKRILERRLGEPVRYFAYPYGDISRRAVELLDENGFGLAMTVERGGNASFANPFALKREMIFGDAGLEDFEKSLRVYTAADLR